MNNHRGCEVTPQVIFMVNFLVNSQIYYGHKMEIANPRNMKICNQTKLGVLNPNPWSEISYQQIFKNSQNEAVH